MKPAVQVTCPNCKSILRVPPDLGDVALKCKQCNFILQLKKRSKNDSPSAPATSPFSTLGANHETMESRIPQSGPSQLASSPLHPHTTASDSPSSFGLGSTQTVSRYRGQYRRSDDRNTKLKWLAVSAILIVGGGLLIAVLAVTGTFKEKEADSKEEASTQKDPPKRQSGGAGKHSNTVIPAAHLKTPAAPAAPFPRRILAIGISDYMFMNPLRSGGVGGASQSDRRDFYKSVDRLRSSWKVPTDQTFYVTDSPLADNQIDAKHPPLKMVIEGAVDQFLATSRAQDHIVLMFAGHAIEKEGKAYLAPMEGEMDELGSLIPLDEIYAKLAKCPAQEKLVIFDVCRNDPRYGILRPAFGKMTEPLEKALHNSPNGVSVWTSCVPGQYSFEYQDVYVSIRGLKQFEIRGSVFLNLFVAHEVRGDARATRDKESGTPPAPPQPSDPLPIVPMSEYVNQFINDAVVGLKEAGQSTKLTLKRRKDWLAYDSKEPPPKKCEFPTPPRGANRDQVVQMFEQISLPGFKFVENEEGQIDQLATNFPFTEESLKDYADDAPRFEDIQKSPEKYAADYPIRVAAVEAIVEMRRLKAEQESEDLPKGVKSPVNDAFKKKITDTYQRTITTRQAVLEEQKEKLDAANKKRDKEKSKRWLANFDYALAQTKIRYAYIYEYNLALAKVKQEQLPELDANALQVGWVLAPVDKMMSPKEIRDMSVEGKNALGELVKEHPNTPWAVMGKTQRSMVIGLRWQASTALRR